MSDRILNPLRSPRARTDHQSRTIPRPNSQSCNAKTAVDEIISTGASEVFMKRIPSIALSLLLLTGFVLAWKTETAFAYIDLGTGSFLLQMLLATLFASLFTIKIFWNRIVTRTRIILVRLGLSKAKAS